MDFIRKILGGIFTRPLRFIYKNGPGVFLLWEGISDESICYEVTNVDSTFWVSSDETQSRCSEIIDRKTTSFIIAVYLLLGIYCLYTVVSLLIYKYFFVSHLSAMITDRIDRIHVTMRNRVDSREPMLPPGPLRPLDEPTIEPLK